MATVTLSLPCPLSGAQLSHLLMGIMKMEISLTGYLALLVSSLPYETDTSYVLRQELISPTLHEEIEAQICLFLPQVT